jgi:hypothetical protein
VIELSAAQVRYIVELAEMCARFSTELVVIGAVAYGVFTEDTDRYTNDVRSAVAPDLDDFKDMQKMREERSSRVFGSSEADRRAP